MGVTWLTAFLDTPAAAADRSEAYWVGVTGWGLSARRGVAGEFATLVPPEGDAYLRVQVVGEAPPGMAHLDVHTDDLDVLAGQVERLGGRVSWQPLGYAVSRSPGGLTFCLVRHDGAVRPAASRWPGGASLVDQICLDIPPARFEAEGEFWAAVTGWARVRGVTPEFDRLLPPPEQPLRCSCSAPTTVRTSRSGCTSTWPARTATPRSSATSGSAERCCAGQSTGRRCSTRRAAPTASPGADRTPGRLP